MISILEDKYLNLARILMEYNYTPSPIFFKTYKEPIGIKAGNGVNVFIPHKIPRGLEPDMVLDLVSDDEKFFFDNRTPYFHTIVHWVRYALSHLKTSNKKITFIFAIGPDNPNQVVQSFSGLTEYLIDRFKELGHSVMFLNDKYAIISNLVVYEELHDFDVESTTEVANFLRKGLEELGEPTEKVYLSRGKTTTFNGNAFMTDISLIDPKDIEAIAAFRDNNIHKFSNRMDDEKLLEDYFRGLGFKVVYPEDFKLYKDQLALLACTKTLVSITSGGLAASLVMQPGTTVVELSTPLEEDSGTFRTHVHYRELSDVNRKTYISIPHGRVAEEVISYIESNNPLKTFLSS